ncbi:MAG: helix-turn-helix domain-containing protein [Cytophagales bacterium]
MERNEVFELAEKFVNQTDKTLFVTGKAGTGKTTFLKHIVNNTHKKCVVAAPTGIAAINAGGVTLHSLLQLPMVPFLPTSNYYDQNQALTPRTLFLHQKMGRDKIKLLKELELLIIDEASMLRADTLDCIDCILKNRRQSNEPFGGLQVLFIGDLFQLPPVVKREEEALLREFYESSYFFSAQVLSNNPAICLELDKVYRQQDQSFVNILNEVRDAKLSNDHLEILNDRYNPVFEADKVGEYITVTSHNVKADEINYKNLEKLKTEEKVYEAERTGEFYLEPVDSLLKLKVGAQIIFLRNDKQEVKRYFNGKIGIIQEIDEKGITVNFPQDHSTFTLEKEIWENKRIEYNDETDEIEEKILGTYVQYPIKLAWAITIHKSQGLTFDKAIIDAGDSFAPGQVYVALSRMRSLGGMVLKSKISQEAIKTDATVREFAKTFEKINNLYPLLEECRKEYLPKLLYKVFDFEKITESFKFFIDNYSRRKIDGLAEAHTWASKVYQTLEKNAQTGVKFIIQLQQILQKSTIDFELLHERSTKGADYFQNELLILLQDIQVHRAKYAIKKNTKAYIREVDSIIMLLKKHKDNLAKAIILTKILAGDESLLEKVLTKSKKENQESSSPKSHSKIDTKQITYDLYVEHKSLEKVAELRGFAVSTICTHLQYFIENGSLSVQEFISKEKLDSILNVIYVSDNTLGIKAIKEQLDDTFSYQDINFALSYLKFEKAQK